MTRKARQRLVAKDATPSPQTAKVVKPTKAPKAAKPAKPTPPKNKTATRPKPSAKPRTQKADPHAPILTSLDAIDKGASNPLNWEQAAAILERWDADKRHPVGHLCVSESHALVPVPPPDDAESAKVRPLAAMLSHVQSEILLRHKIPADFMPESQAAGLQLTEAGDGPLEKLHAELLATHAADHAVSMMVGTPSGMFDFNLLRRSDPSLEKTFNRVQRSSRALIETRELRRKAQRDQQMHEARLELMRLEAEQRKLRLLRDLQRLEADHGKNRPQDLSEDR